MKRTFLLLACFWACGVAGQAAPPPNIVFFLADDLGQRDLGAYGSTFYETPHLDRLARDGAKFTDAYAACPVCSPTASCLAKRLGLRQSSTAFPPRQEISNSHFGRLSSRL